MFEDYLRIHQDLYVVKFTSPRKGRIVWDGRKEHTNQIGYFSDSWNEKDPDFFLLPRIYASGTYYPYIGISKSTFTTVQFTGKRSGVVLWVPKGHKENKVGDTSNEWNEECFDKLPKLEKLKEKKEKNKMSTENLLSNVLESNQKAAVEATKLNSAKIALDLLQQVAKKNLPAELSVYADNPIGLLVIANVVNQLVPRVTQNEFACEMVDNALVVAYQEVLSQLGIHNIVQQFVNSIGLLAVPKE